MTKTLPVAAEMRLLFPIYLWLLPVADYFELIVKGNVCLLIFQWVKWNLVFHSLWQGLWRFKKNDINDISIPESQCNPINNKLIHYSHCHIQLQQLQTKFNNMQKYFLKFQSFNQVQKQNKITVVHRGRWEISFCWRTRIPTKVLM